MPNCVICNREVSKGSFSMKDKYELTGGGFICKTCAEKIGVKNFMTAGMLTAAKARKKYLSLYPEETSSNSVNAEEEKALDEQFIEKVNNIPGCHIILQNEMKQLRRVVTDGEEVIHAVNGMMKKDSFALIDGRTVVGSSGSVSETWLAAVTNTRMIFVNKHLVAGSDCISIPLEAIASVSYRTMLADSTVTIMYGMTGLVLEHIQKGYEKPFTDKANEAIRNVRNGSATQLVQEKKQGPSSTADELMKWHNLLKEGVITQEEFNSQKAKLLK